MTDTKKLPVVVHVGYPKAASTFLQGFFKGHDEVDFRHVKLTALGSNSADGEDFSSGEQTSGAKVRLVSNEKIAEALIMTGQARAWNKNRFIPGAWKAVAPHVYYDQAETARRVKTGFGADKALVVLREQSSWLISAYKFFQPRLPHNRRSFKDFSETPRGIIYHKMARYDETVSAYVDVFGAKNVCVLRFEDLVENRPRFEYAVCEFLAISPRPMPVEVANKGSSDAVAKLRAGFPLLDKMPVSLKRLGKAVINALPSMSGPVLDQKQISQIKDQFDQSNQKLAEIVINTSPPQKVERLGPQATRPAD